MRASIGDPEECLAPQGVSVVRAAGPRQASFWTVGSDGRASASHAEGHRFESCTVHGEHGMVPRCYRSLLVVAYVTVWARVVGLRASRWACYCVSIAARCPPGLPSCNVSVAELADALDLGSSAFGRVGSTPTGHTGASLNQVGIVGSRCSPRLVVSAISIRVAGSAPETLNARGEDVRRTNVPLGADFCEARTKQSPAGGVRLGAGLGNEAM